MIEVRTDQDVALRVAADLRQHVRATTAGDRLLVRIETRRA